eukprot:IDg19123t1
MKDHQATLEMKAEKLSLPKGIVAGIVPMLEMLPTTVVEKHNDSEKVLCSPEPTKASVQASYPIRVYHLD